MKLENPKELGGIVSSMEIEIPKEREGLGGIVFSIKLENSKELEVLGGIFFSIGIEFFKEHEEFRGIVLVVFTGFKIPNEDEGLDGIASIFSMRLKFTEDCDF